LDFLQLLSHLVLLVGMRHTYRRKRETKSEDQCENLLHASLPNVGLRFHHASPLNETPSRPEIPASVVVHRILRAAVLAHFEVQVGTGGSSVVSDGGD